MPMDLFYKLFGGEIGEVRDYDDWDEERDMISIDGVDYQLGEEVGDIDTFLNLVGTEGLVLFRTDGYRGLGCYSGYIKHGEDEYTLDINNDYVAYRIHRT